MPAFLRALLAAGAGAAEAAAARWQREGAAPEPLPCLAARGARRAGREGSERIEFTFFCVFFCAWPVGSGLGGAGARRGRGL